MKKLKTTKKATKSIIKGKENLSQKVLEQSNQKISDEVAGIIPECREQNKIEILAEEDLTNIFGREASYPDYDKLMSEPIEWPDTSWMTVDEWLELWSGVNNLSGSDSTSMSNEFDDIDLGSADQLSESDEFMELFENENYPYWLSNDYPEISEAHFWKQYEKDIEIEMMKELYNMGDADSLNEGEWECSLKEELEHKLSLRTETVEVHVTDFADFSYWLYRGMKETTYLLKIHWNTRDRKFLIKVSDEEQFYYYQVILEFDSNNGKSSLYLGSDTWRSSVLGIIDYYLETGNSTEDN